MAEAGEVGHWKVLKTMTDGAGYHTIAELCHWAIPIQERHLADVNQASLKLAASEDPRHSQLTRPRTYGPRSEECAAGREVQHAGAGISGRAASPERIAVPVYGLVRLLMACSCGFRIRGFLRLPPAQRLLAWRKTTVTRRVPPSGETPAVQFRRGHRWVRVAVGRVGLAAR
jgi:hypothetical protein